MDAKRSAKRKLALIKKAMLAIILFATLVFIFTIYFTRSYTDVAREMLEAIRAEAPAHAYTLMAKDYQAHTSLNEFQAYIEIHPVLKDFTNVSFDEHKVENNLSYIQGVITAPDGGQQRIEIEMIKENDQWKVQALKVGE